jgi:hypothetical protein
MEADEELVPGELLVAMRSEKTERWPNNNKLEVGFVGKTMSHYKFALHAYKNINEERDHV